MKYWLMKTEPDQYSFQHLVNASMSTDCWDGIRNYQARNIMRDDMKKGDLAFIYHSRIAQPCIVGVAEIVKEAYGDPTALDKASKYFDPKSVALGSSRWCMVDVQARSFLQAPVTLAAMREMAGLEKMALLKKGQRLSIQPVTMREWNIIIKAGGGESPLS